MGRVFCLREFPARRHGNQPYFILLANLVPHVAAGCHGNGGGVGYDARDASRADAREAEGVGARERHCGSDGSAARTHQRNSPGTIDAGNTAVVAVVTRKDCKVFESEGTIIESGDAHLS